MCAWRFFVGWVWLLDEVRRVLQRESQLAREDALMQLPNRREFHERGRAAFVQAQRQGAPFSVVFIDLDRFKQVNDELGHEAGDRLLAKVAEVMRLHVRTSDVAAAVAQVVLRQGRRRAAGIDFAG